MSDSSKDLKVIVNQRFIEVSSELIAIHKLSNQTRFSNSIGESAQFMTDIKKGKRYVNTNHLVKLIKEYPEVNIRYILTGKGNILEEPENEIDEVEIKTDTEKKLIKLINYMEKEIEEYKLDIKTFERALKANNIDIRKLLGGEEEASAG